MKCSINGNYKGYGEKSGIEKEQVKDIWTGMMYSDQGELIEFSLLNISGIYMKQFLNNHHFFVRR